MGIFSIKKKKELCPECNEKFSKLDELVNHGQTIHNQIIKNCSLCNSSFFSPQLMIEHTKEKHHKVKIGWQIVFLFVPFVSIWAYYRIKRLDDGIVLSAGLIGLLYGGIILMIIVGNASDPNFENEFSMWLMVLAMFVSLGITIWLKIHYMLKWSREWNKKINSQIELLSKEEPKQD